MLMLCKKITYNTENIALENKERIKNELGIELFSYKCKQCKKFHLTKYENTIDKPYILDITSDLYTILKNAMSNFKTSTKKISNRTVEHTYTLYDIQYKYIYNKHTKNILITAILKLDKE